MSPQAAISRTERNSTTGTSGAATVRERFDTHAHLLVHRRRDNNAHPQRNRPNQDRQRDILILDNLPPQMIRRHLVDEHKRKREDHDAQKRIDQRVQQHPRVEVSHVLFSSDVAWIEAIVRPVRARIIAHRFRDVLHLVYAAEGPAAKLRPGDARKQHHAVNQVARKIHLCDRLNPTRPSPADSRCPSSASLQTHVSVLYTGSAEAAATTPRSKTRCSSARRAAT